MTKTEYLSLAQIIDSIRNYIPPGDSISLTKSSRIKCSAQYLIHAFAAACKLDKYCVTDYGKVLLIELDHHEYPFDLKVFKANCGKKLCS